MERHDRPAASAARLIRWRPERSYRTARAYRRTTELLVNHIVRTAACKGHVLDAYDERCAVTELRMVNGDDKAEQRNAELEPKAAALARLTDADGSLCVTDAAKALGVGPRALFAWLERNDWIHPRASGWHWIGYQAGITAGLVEHKVARIAQHTGSDKFREQVLITPKGVARLAEVCAGR